MNLKRTGVDMPDHSQPINLFEYANKEIAPDNSALLESFLDDLWQRRDRQPDFYQDISEEDDFSRDISSKQKFLTFLRNGHIQSRKYVGVIHYNGQTINLLPKIFYGAYQAELPQTHIDAIHANMLWWFSYCRKIKFSTLKTGLGSLKSSFFEILIYIYASRTRDILNHCLYQSYMDISGGLPYMKGRLNVNRYITNNISTGEWHKLACDYNSFEFDNLFNRIIKYVARLLLGTTGNKENRAILSQVLFILDDVSDVTVVYGDCDKVRLNPLYEDMQAVLDYCRLFLGNSITFSYKNQFKVFAFLLPMEYVFEDFIFGFLEQHNGAISGLKKLSYQKSDLFLANLHEDDFNKGRIFNLKPDICFEYQHRPVIADAKYKLTYIDDPAASQTDLRKHGVMQSDLYQMVAYAIRRNVLDVFMIYPQSFSEQFSSNANKAVKFTVHDEFAEQDININILKIPIIHLDFPNIDLSENLQKSFEKNRQTLLSKFSEALQSIN